MANTKISALTALASADDADLLAIVDVSATTTKKITVADLLAGVPSYDQSLNTDDSPTFAGVTLTGGRPLDPAELDGILMEWELDDSVADEAVYGIYHTVETAGVGATHDVDSLNLITASATSNLPSGRTLGDMVAIAAYARNQAEGDVTRGIAYYAAVGGKIGDGYGYYLNFGGSGGANLYGFYATDLAGLATQPYYDWFDSRGVAATREEFSQAVTRLYNPEVTKYTPGAADYERIFYARWGQTGDYGTDNIGYIGAEAGGTGTLRNLNILGAEVGIMSVPGTYATVRAGGYKSSDGTAGVTAGPFTAITAITVKNGLVTAITGT